MLKVNTRIRNRQWFGFLPILNFKTNFTPVFIQTGSIPKLGFLMILLSPALVT